MTTEKSSKSTQPIYQEAPEVVPRQGLSIVWFVPLIALLFGLWLAIKVISEQGTFITIEFENGTGIVPNKTEVRYKGLITGMVKSVKPSDDLQHVIATVEISANFSDYLSENTRFWLVSADISLQGVSGLDTLLSGSYINILPSSDFNQINLFALKSKHYTALHKAPLLDMSTPGLHLTLQTSVLGSISENSPITFKQMPIGNVVSYHYLEKTKKIAINIFIEPEFAHLVKENSLFWNASGVQVTASLSSGLNINTESLSSIISGGIAVDTLTYQEDLAPAQNGQIYPLHADFQEAEMGHEIELTLDWNSGINHNAAILFQGLAIGEIKSFSKIDPKTRELVAIAHVNPRVVPYLTDQSQFYLVAPSFGLSGVANAKTLLTGTYISMRLSLQGEVSNKFKVYSAKPPYKYSEPGLHLVLQSNDRSSLQVGSNVYYKQQVVGSVQAIETVGADQHLLHIHISPEFQQNVLVDSHFYNNSGIKISANLLSVDIQAESLQSILTGGISFSNNEKIRVEDNNSTSTTVVKNGDKFRLYANEELAKQRTRFTLTISVNKPVKANTRILYRGNEIGAIHRVEHQGDYKKLTVGLLPEYQYILRDSTQFWLVKPNLTLSGATDTEALLGGDYITFNLGELTKQAQLKNSFTLLTSPPAKYASAAGLQLSLISQSANVASPGSAVSYRGIVVGQVDSVHLDKLADNVRVNITIDEEHKALIQMHTRFYNASGVTLSGGLSNFVVKTESIDAILRGGISFYTPKPITTVAETKESEVKELDLFTLFNHIKQAENAGLSINIHFNDVAGLKVNTKVLYQEQELGVVERLVFSDDKVGVTALVILNDKGAKYAVQNTQFWKVEPEIGLVGSKNINALFDGAFIALLPSVNTSATKTSKTQTLFEALELPPAIKELPYGLNLKLTAKRLGSVRIGNPVLYRQVKVGKVIGIDLSDSADTVDVFINIAKRYAPLINDKSKFWNTSGINIEAGIFSGVKIDSESIETLISGGIAFASPVSDSEEVQQGQRFILHQNLDKSWLDWQPKINIAQE